MEYQSTRNSKLRLSASQVIAKGISEEGGLFVPKALPDLRGELSALAGLSYKALAKRVFSVFLTDFTEEEIDECVEKAYSPEKFGGEEPVKLVPLTGSGAYLLELWHGPTCAFKDMALQALPYLLTNAVKKAAPGMEAVILTATSGDTGKAALEGFRDVKGTRILVFYPQNGVSSIQKLQMTTQEGGNVAVCAIDGNFDDAQSAVKRIFTDGTMKSKLEEVKKMFSSANSINWGRLLPQIVYYFYAYFSLCRSGVIECGKSRINIAVPTGNFGNILAAYYAMRMGLPVKKFLCASNKNRVLTDFIRTGVYDRRREFFATTSPSMDILISSNLERLLFALSGEDDVLLSGWMDSLSKTGAYTVSDSVLQKLQKLFYGGSCDEKATARTIADCFRDHGYLCDPHTAVGLEVYRQYKEETCDSTPTVIASTASPYKFSGSVLSALGKAAPEDGFEAMMELERVSGTRAPDQLLTLRGKKPRFTETVEKDRAEEFVRQTVGIGGR